jgi:hypothetical protein
MKTANQQFLTEILNPLTGMADDDQMVASFRNLEVNNPSEIKKVLCQTILPEFNKRPEAYQSAAKSSLSYYLTSGNADFEGVFYSALLPFRAPDNIKQFFVWVWEILWEEEDYKVLDVTSFKETDDIHEPIRLSMKK